MSETFYHPGAVDVHVHLREPSTNHAENILSGTEAAAYGGYVALADMSNNPGHPTDSRARSQQKIDLFEQKAVVATGTNAGAQPEFDNVGELASMAELSLLLKLYATLTTGNDREYEVSDFAEQIAEWHRSTIAPIAVHAGADNLEDFIGKVAGDLRHALHVCHISNRKDLDLVRGAKKRGLPVTAGVTPHHIFKDSHDAFTEGWFARIQPPLAHQTEAEELFRALSSGDIDIVETDHAPHTADTKWATELANPNAELDPDHATCFGVPNIEQTLPLLFRQVKLGTISMERLIDATSGRPAEILGIKLSKSTKVEWDNTEYRIGDETDLRTGAGWTPFLGKLALGRVRNMTIGGKTIISDGCLHTPAHLSLTRGSTI